MNITIIGTGYVGLTAAICFANNGHKIICIDKDPSKINLLKAKKSPIYEKNMEKMLCKAIDNGNIEFSSDLEYGVKSSIISHPIEIIQKCQTLTLLIKPNSAYSPK